METGNSNKKKVGFSLIVSKHPIIFNFIIISIIAIIGILIAYYSIAIFTRHGEYNVVPLVEKMNYSSAIEKLRQDGFKTEISDSTYRDDILPGCVIEQSPKANSKVKPGRVVYLIINATTPKKVTISNIEGISVRQAKAILEGLGFKNKNIKVVYRLGKHKDLVQAIKSNGKKIYPGQKVAVNSNIVLEVSDGRIEQITDSLLNIEYGLEDIESNYTADDSYIPPTPSVEEPHNESEVEESTIEEEESNSFME